MAAHRKRIDRMRGMYGITGKTELPDLQPQRKPEVIPEEIKEKEEVKLPPLHSRLLPPISSHFTATKAVHSLPQPHVSPKKVSSPLAEVEEDIDLQADGLLKWVEELPEEMSMSSSTHRLAIAL